MPHGWLPSIKEITAHSIAHAVVVGAVAVGSAVLTWWATPSNYTRLDTLFVFFAFALASAVCLTIIPYGVLAWRRLLNVPTVSPVSVAAGDVYRQKNRDTAALIGTPHIEWANDGRIVFKGRYEYSGRDLVVYVTYVSMGRGMPVREHSVLSGTVGGRTAREKLSTISRFDRGEAANITIGRVSQVEGNQEVLRWGEKQTEGSQVGITWGNYFGHILLVESNGVEHAYPFAIITRSFETSPMPPLIISPDLMQAHAAMMGIKAETWP